jgi:PhzF family phenazine biosynthesis protein
MQNVAMEMNQAETAFFWPVAGGYGLRWFTPACEVDLCGHATLASAHVLFSENSGPAAGAAREDARPPGDVSFFTKSGELVCRQVEGGIEMDFPAEPPTEVEPFSVVDALGVQPVWMGANRMDWFFELASADELLALQPDMAAVKALGKRGVIVTAPHPQPLPSNAHEHRVRGEGSTDFLSRFFAPQSGIDEDPVTGSAHCALGPYWAAKLGRTTVTGYQASKRGGTVGVDVCGDRVGLTGTAVTTLVGELRL